MFKNLFKKEKNPKIIWWSTIDGLEKIEPVLPAKNFIPDWWKQTEKNFDKIIEKIGETNGTVKNCPSFSDYLTEGFVVPLWCDLKIKITENNFEYNTPDNAFTFTTHINEQYKNYIPDNAKQNCAAIVKPNCPWRVKTPPGYSLWQFPMYYNFNPIFEVLPGVIWSDIYCEINQQMAFKNYGEYFIKRGTPLAVYIPFKRQEFECEIQNSTEENRKWESESYTIVRSKFTGGYKLQQDKTKKCPFKI